MLKINSIIISSFLLLAPSVAFALQMPQSGSELAEIFGISAPAYVVADAGTGEILISKNADLSWVPASLTKLVTMLVVLDTKPKLTKTVVMTQGDQTNGYCKAGGVCIKSKAGVKFTVDGLFHAALMLSANNAASALARSTGLSKGQFVARMNKKAKSLGARNTNFVEPTGMDPSNITTAADYSKIVTAAFSLPYLSGIANEIGYTLKSANNSKYTQEIKNGNKLLGDAEVKILGGKTGYLNESKYNFASLLKSPFQRQLAIVVLGEDHMYTAFDETKQLARLSGVANFFSFFPVETVAGTSTNATIN